jgi:hypothetical protein
MSEATQPNELKFSVTHGNPTAEELAVAIAVLQAAAGSAQAGPTISEPASSWSRNVGLLRVPIAPGLGQWNAAYRKGLTR